MARPSYHALLWLLLLGGAGAWAQVAPPDDAQADEAADTQEAVAAAEALAEASATIESPNTPIDVADTEAESPYAQLRRQIELKELDSAAVEVDALMARLEEEHHRYAEALAEPLLLRGDLAFERGAYEEALDDYGRSVHIERVNAGLHNPAQVEAVYREARTLKAMGLVSEASRREEYAYEVLRKHHGTYSPELLPGLYHLASWQEATNNVFGARRLYGQAVLILESAQQDPLSPELIKPLTGLARSYRLERFPRYYVRESSSGGFTGGSVAADLYDGQRPLTLNNFPAGQKALERIVEIRRLRADEEPVPLAEAILELGDWHLLFEKTRLAGQYYQHVERILNEVNETAAETLFSQATLLHFPQPIDPKQPTNRLKPVAVRGHVEVGFTVTDRGTTSRLVTISSEPSGLMDFRVRKSLRAARYRPPLVDGQFQTASDQRFRHEFWYYPNEKPVEATKPDDAPSAESAEDPELNPGAEDGRATAGEPS